MFFANSVPRRIEQLKAKLAATAHVMKAEAAAVRGAELFWVTRDMVDVVLHAARSLPEWSPALAAPAPTGLLCLLDPRVPRTDEVNGSEHAHPFVSAIGAAWLLMAQPNVAETRTIGSAPHPGPRPQPINREGEQRPASEPSTVTIVELRRRPSPPRAPGESGRKLDHRITVSGLLASAAMRPGPKPAHTEIHRRL